MGEYTESFVEVRSLDITKVKYLNVGQAAELLGLSIATVRKWVWKKYIPYIKMGKLVRFSASDLQDWAKSMSVGPKRPRTQGHEGGGK
jgi:excisionase family DNA binding protein